MTEILNSVPEQIAPTNEQMANLAALLRQASDALTPLLSADTGDDDTQGAFIEDGDIYLDRQIPGPFDFRNDFKLLLVSDDTQEAYGRTKIELLDWIRVELKSAASDEFKNERESLWEEARFISIKVDLETLEQKINKGPSIASGIYYRELGEILFSTIEAAEKQNYDVADFRAKAEMLREKTFAQAQQYGASSALDLVDLDWDSPTPYSLKTD